MFQIDSTDSVCYRQRATGGKLQVRFVRDSPTIYADYQATTPVDPRVVEKMAPFWRNAFGNPHSNDHIIGWKANESVMEAATSVANLIGAASGEILFTSGATEANNLVLQGLARRAPPERRRILVSAIEHKCVLAAANILSERHGFRIETIPVDPEGFIDLAWLKTRLDSTVLVVSAMAVNNEIGTIQDIPSIAALVQHHGTLLHCDAAQAPCACDVSDLAAHADFVSLSGHKIYGPQGIGALYIRQELKSQVEPLIYGGGQQEGLRSGTVPVPLCIGMGAAAEILSSPVALTERHRIAEHRDKFINYLQAGRRSIFVNGALGDRRHPGNSNIRFDGCDARDILGALQPRLAASTGAACASGLPQPSHVLGALGMTELESNASIRFSFGRFTTDNEVCEAAELVLAALARVSTL